MLASRVTVRLNPDDARALLELAQREYRDPRAQAAILIREALERRGLLGQEESPSTKSFQIMSGMDNEPKAS